jgi:hypothetical protein
MKMRFEALGATVIALQSAACVGRLDVGQVAGGDDSGRVANTNQESASGSGCGTSGSSSSGCNTPDGSTRVGDSTVIYDAAPAGLAGFSFVVNGVVQHPLACPSANWEFDPNAVMPPDEGGIEYLCGAPETCPGVNSVVIVNTGQLSMAYVAQSTWSLPGHYEPGVPTGEPNQLVGVLNPGGSLDITSVFVGGITALLGSADPFSLPGKDVVDEGTIPWPAGVAGRGGAQFMSVAQIDAYFACGNVGSTF